MYTYVLSNQQHNQFQMSSDKANNLYHIQELPNKTARSFFRLQIILFLQMEQVPSKSHENKSMRKLRVESERKRQSVPTRGKTTTQSCC